jgi:hypothetical protein
VVLDRGVPVAAEVIQGGIVVIPVADPAVAAPGAFLNDPLRGPGERGGVGDVGGADDDEGPGTVPGAQLGDEALVGGLVGGNQALLRGPTLARVQRGREVVPRPTTTTCGRQVCGVRQTSPSTFSKARS